MLVETFTEPAVTKLQALWIKAFGISVMAVWKEFFATGRLSGYVILYS
jgi:hypothetical protein